MCVYLVRREYLCVVGEEAMCVFGEEGMCMFGEDEMCVCVFGMEGILFLFFFCFTCGGSVIFMMGLRWGKRCSMNSSREARSATSRITGRTNGTMVVLTHSRIRLGTTLTHNIAKSRVKVDVGAVMKSEHHPLYSTSNWFS